MSTFSTTNGPRGVCSCGHADCPICNPPKYFTHWGQIDGNIINQKDLVDWLATKQDDRNAIREAVIFNQDNKQDMFPDYSPIGRADNRYGNEPSRAGYNQDDIMTAGITLPVTTQVLQRGAKNFGAARPVTEIITEDQAEPPKQIVPGTWKKMGGRLDAIPTATAVRTNINRVDANIGFNPPADAHLGHTIQEQINVNRTRMVNAEQRLDDNDIHNADQDAALAKLDRQIGRAMDHENDPELGGVNLQTQINTLETYTGVTDQDYDDLGGLQTQIKTNDHRAQDAEQALDTKYEARTQGLDDRLTALDDTAQYLAGNDLNNNPVNVSNGKVLRLEELTGINDTDYIQEGSLQYQIQSNYQYFESIKNATQVIQLDGILLDRVPNNITMVPSTLLPSYMSKVQGIPNRLLVNDTNGTVAVYVGMNPNSSAQMQFKTITISPFGEGHHALLGVIETKAALDALATMHDVQAAFPLLTTLPTIDDYIWVTNDESKYGAVVKYFITDIEPPSGAGVDPTTQVMTYGGYEIISTPTGQAPTTSAMIGRLLTGGTQPGQFGKSIGILDQVEQGADDIATSNAVFDFVDPQVQRIDQDIADLTQEMHTADDTLQTNIDNLEADTQTKLDGKQTAHAPVGQTGGFLLTGSTTYGEFGPPRNIASVIPATGNGNYIPTVNAVRTMLSADGGLQSSIDPATMDGKLLTGGPTAGSFGSARDIVDTTTGIVVGAGGIPTAGAIAQMLNDLPVQGGTLGTSSDYKVTFEATPGYSPPNPTPPSTSAVPDYWFPMQNPTIQDLVNIFGYNPIPCLTGSMQVIQNSPNDILVINGVQIGGSSTDTIPPSFGTSVFQTGPSDAGKLLTGGITPGTFGTPYAIATTIDVTDPAYDAGAVPTVGLLSSMGPGGGLSTTIDASGKVTLTVDNIIINGGASVSNVNTSVSTSVVNKNYVDNALSTALATRGFTSVTITATDPGANSTLATGAIVLVYTP